jgi:hypothetical protein
MEYWLAENYCYDGRSVGYALVWRQANAPLVGTVIPGSGGLSRTTKHAGIYLESASDGGYKYMGPTLSREDREFLIQCRGFSEESLSRAENSAREMAGEALPRLIAAHEKRTARERERRIRARGARYFWED